MGPPTSREPELRPCADAHVGSGARTPRRRVRTPEKIGQMLGVSLQRARQLAAEPGFPEPSQVAGRSRLWHRYEVEAWATRRYWARKPWYPREAEEEA